MARCRYTLFITALVMYLCHHPLLHRCKFKLVLFICVCTFGCFSQSFNQFTLFLCPALARTLSLVLFMNLQILAVVTAIASVRICHFDFTAELLSLSFARITILSIQNIQLSGYNYWAAHGNRRRKESDFFGFSLQFCICSF